MDSLDQTRHQAEARALATLEEAVARAEAVALRAEESVKELIDGHCRRIQELDCPVPDVDIVPSLSHWEKIAKEYINKHLPSTDAFREVVSIRAYYKAEQRDFGSGQEELDWHEAEQELLDALKASPFDNQPVPSSRSRPPES